jgi:hypothetical protein
VDKSKNKQFLGVFGIGGRGGKGFNGMHSMNTMEGNGYWTIKAEEYKKNDDNEHDEINNRCLTYVPAPQTGTVFDEFNYAALKKTHATYNFKQKPKAYV